MTERKGARKLGDASENVKQNRLFRGFGQEILYSEDELMGCSGHSSLRVDRHAYVGMAVSYLKSNLSHINVHVRTNQGLLRTNEK